MLSGKVRLCNAKKVDSIYLRPITVANYDPRLYVHVCANILPICTYYVSVSLADKVRGKNSPWACISKDDALSVFSGATLALAAKTPDFFQKRST